MTPNSTWVRRNGWLCSPSCCCAHQGPSQFSGRADALAWITAERNLLPVLAQDRRHDLYGETLRQHLTSALEMSPQPYGD